MTSPELPSGDAKAASVSYDLFTCACMLSRFSCVNFAMPWTVALQDPVFMRFSREEYYSGFSCPPPGIFLIWGSNSPLLTFLLWQPSSLPLVPTWEAHTIHAHANDASLFSFPSRNRRMPDNEPWDTAAAVAAKHFSCVSPCDPMTVSHHPGLCLLGFPCRVLMGIAYPGMSQRKERSKGLTYIIPIFQIQF